MEDDCQSNKRFDDKDKEGMKSKEEKNFIENETIILKSDLSSREIALNIIKVSKFIFEKIAFETKNANLEQRIKEKIQFDFSYKEYRDFNLSLYDEHYKYYDDLQKYLLYFFQYYDISLYFNSSYFQNIRKNYISVYYLSVLIDLLLQLLHNNPNAHEDKIIKFDISVICEFFREKNKRLCTSNSFFYCCVSELKEKYKLNDPIRNEFRNKIFQIQREKAQSTLQKAKESLPKYVRKILSNYREIKHSELAKEKNSIKDDKTSLDYNNHLEDFKSLNELCKENFVFPDNFEDSKKMCETKNISKYLNEYTLFIVKYKSYSSEADKKKYIEYIYNNCLLPLNLLKIDIEEEKNINILSVIDYDENMTFDQFSPYGDTFYENYLEKKEEIEYLNQQNYEREINEILNDKQFQKDFLSIIKSLPVKNYLTSVVKFKNDKDDDYNDELYDLSNKTKSKDTFDLELEGDIYLGPQYESFYNDISRNFDSFNKLIVIKELGYKIPSCTGPSMRIFINPRLHFSQEAIKDNSQRKSILKSALIVLLLHEIAHLLKYYPINDIYPKEYPFTPKNKENGKCFMNYLFKNEVINKISFHQATKINNLSNWEDLNHIRNIFKNAIETDINGKLKEKEGELDLYSSESKKSRKKSKKIEPKTDYCWW